MIATVDNRYRTALLTEELLGAIALRREITVNEQCSPAASAPERFCTVEVEVAMTIDSRTIQRIVGTLEMAVFIIRIGGTIQGIEVQTTDEAHPVSNQAVAMDITNMGLRDSLVALSAVEPGIQRINQVYIAVITHREVVYTERLHPEVKHGEVSDSPLCLSPLRGQQHILRLLSHSDEMDVFALNNHPKWFPSVLSYPHSGVVRVVNPIDSRTDIDGDAIHEMCGSLLESLIDIRGVGNSLRINHDMEGIEALGKSHCGQKSPQQQKSAH